MDLNEILKMAIREDASDIHLKPGMQPIIRRKGKLLPLQAPLVTKLELENTIKSLIKPELFKKYKNNEEIDIGLSLPELGRFRLNICSQVGLPRIVIRSIPHKIPNLKDLNLPEIVQKIPKIERGLILITGTTGSGKSTTIASILNHINQTRNKHIISIEDPIEYALKDKKCLITQREVLTDSLNFKSALKAALRQDPDIIFIGEMRDTETIKIALQAAATGHLILSTLHTLDAKETINRILSYFPPEGQQSVRLQLASALKIIVSQRLSHGKSGNFIPAVEILINNKRVKRYIEDPKKTNSITSLIEEGQTYSMQTFDQSLMNLLLSGKISYKEAEAQSSSPNDFSIKYNNMIKLNNMKESNVIRNLPKDKKRNASFWNNIEDIELESQEKSGTKKKGKVKKF